MYKEFDPGLTEGDEYVPCPLQHVVCSIVCKRQPLLGCTLIIGHKGPHVAHGGGDPARMLATWDDALPPELEEK